MQIGFIVIAISKGTLKNTIKSEDLNTNLLLTSKAQNNLNTLILLVRSKNRSISVTLLNLTTPISAIAVVKVKYIKVIGRNLYLVATMMSLKVISINIITQQQDYITNVVNNISKRL